MFIGLLIFATLLVVAGYVVLHFSTQAQGGMQIFGKFLSYWVFILAAVLVIGALSAPYFGGTPFGMRMMMGGQGAHGMMGRGQGGMMERPATQAPGTTEPTAPPTN